MSVMQSPVENKLSVGIVEDRCSNFIISRCSYFEPFGFVYVYSRAFLFRLGDHFNTLFYKVENQK
jgi:hypothetical protein